MYSLPTTEDQSVALTFYVPLPQSGDTIQAIEPAPITRKAGKSEIANLLREIDETYEAARQGLNGLSAGSARHAFIDAKMERIDSYRERLVTMVGHDTATALIYDTLMREGD
jgi:hypothetical protein